MGRPCDPGRDIPLRPAHHDRSPLSERTAATPIPVPAVGADSRQPTNNPERPAGWLPPVGHPAAHRSGTGALAPELARPQEGRFINRELSWLDFAARLLDLASDRRLPLFERVKFVAIFAEGLDEFFQVRVAGLEDQVAAGLVTRSPDGLRPRQQLAAITARATELVARQNTLFHDELAPTLARNGVVVADWHTLEAGDRATLGDLFDRGIFPILTPLAVDQGHPFPYISNLSLNLVVRVANPRTHEERIARVKVPPLLSRLVGLPDAGRFVPVEQVIAAHLERLFPSMDILEHHVFRVTRNADLSVEEDDADDLLAARRARTPPSAVRPGGPSGGLGRDRHRPARPAHRRGRRARGQRVPVRRAPRPGRAVAPSPTWTAPTWPPRPGPRWHLPASKVAVISSPCWPNATCWSTTPTSRSQRRWRPSWPWPPTTPRCWPSSRPSTGRVRTARWWPR